MFAPDRLFPIDAPAHAGTVTPLQPPPGGQAAAGAIAQARPRASRHFSSIGLIGFGAFARLIARHAPADARLLAYDVCETATDGYTVCKATLAEVAGCDLVVIAAPVAATAQICQTISPMLRPGALVVDVGSVKVKPAADMLAHLPAHVEIAGLHPLFGPQSAGDGVAGHRVVLCPLRGRRSLRLAAVLRRMGLQVQIATPEAHDREMAMVQGVTHMIGRLVAQIDNDGAAGRSRMATRSFALLMQAVDMVRHDNPAVFDAIVLANPYVSDVQDQFFAAADQMRAVIGARRVDAA